jgi:hypothetical protein
MTPHRKYASRCLYGVVRFHLCECGLLEADADAVLQRLVCREDSRHGGGATKPQAALVSTAKAEAVARLDETGSKHWARAMLVDAEPASPSGASFPKL